MRYRVSGVHRASFYNEKSVDMFAEGDQSQSFEDENNKGGINPSEEHSSEDHSGN